MKELFPAGRIGVVGPVRCLERGGLRHVTAKTVFYVVFRIHSTSAEGSASKSLLRLGQERLEWNKRRIFVLLRVGRRH